jgi:hypothetical protein
MDFLQGVNIGSAFFCAALPVFSQQENSFFDRSRLDLDVGHRVHHCLS